MEWIELYCGIAWFALLLHATPLLEERSCAQGSSPLVTNDNGNFTSSLKNHVAHSIEYTPPPKDVYSRSKHAVFIHCDLDMRPSHCGQWNCASLVAAAPLMGTASSYR